jgi:4'-phosphopantetheinyl transferase
MAEARIDTCEIWYANPRLTHASYAGLLTPSEHARFLSFSMDIDRLRFMTGRALLRLVLSQRLYLPIDQIDIVQECIYCGGSHGKPHLQSGEVDFSIAHSGDYVVIAFASRRRVGIDIEPLKRDLSVDELSHLVLTQGERSLLREVHGHFREELFLQFWTRKEALLKCLGIGITVPLHNLYVSPLDNPPVSIWPDSLGKRINIQVIDLDFLADHLGCLVLEGGTESIRTREATEVLMSFPADLRRSRRADQVIVVADQQAGEPASVGRS